MDPQIIERKTVSCNGRTYEFLEKLGEGGFGQVYKAKVYSNEEYYINLFLGKLNETSDSQGRTFAVKIVDKRQLNNPQNANREIHMMKSLDDHNIIKLFDAMEIWGNNGENSIYLFMEYARHGDLHSHIKKNSIDEIDAKFLFRQIVTGVEYLHSKRIAHRDLKPQNILVTDKLSSLAFVKITDFGLSKKLNNDDAMLSRCGTPRYAAPEILDQNIPSYNGCKADIYSLGIILIDLVTNYGKKQMSSDCEALFKKLTSVNPLSRPTASEILKDKFTLDNLLAQKLQRQQQEKMGDRRPPHPLQSKCFSYDRQDRERHFDEALGAYDDRQLDPYYNRRSNNRLPSPPRNSRREPSPLPRPNDDIRRSRRNEEDYGRNNSRVPQGPVADDYGRGGGGDRYSRQPSRNDIDSGIGSGGPGRNSSNEYFRDRRDDDDRWNEHDDRSSRRYSDDGDRRGSNISRQASRAPGYDRYADSDYRNEPRSRQENFRHDDYGSDSRFSRNDETMRDRDGRNERQASRIQSPTPARREYANSRNDERLRHANNRRRSPSPNPPRREYADASNNERINLDNMKDGQWLDWYAERNNAASRSSRNENYSRNDERDNNRGYGRGDSKEPLRDDRLSQAEKVKRHLHDEAVKELIANSQISRDVESDDEVDERGDSRGSIRDNRQSHSRSDSRRNSPPKYFDRFGNYPFKPTKNDKHDDRDSGNRYSGNRRYSNDAPQRAERNSPLIRNDCPRRNDENFDDRNRSSRQGYKSPEFNDHAPPPRKDEYRNDPYEDDARSRHESYDRLRRTASPDYDAPPRPTKNEMIRRDSNTSIPYSNQDRGYRTSRDQDPNRTPTPTRGEYGLDARDGGYGNGAAPPRGRDDFGPAKKFDYPDDRSARGNDIGDGSRDDRGSFGGGYRHGVEKDGYRNPQSGRRDSYDDSGYIDNRRSAKQEDFGGNGGSQLTRGGYDPAAQDNGYNNNSANDYGSRQYSENSRPTQSSGGGAAPGGYESHPNKDGAIRGGENNKVQYPPPADSGYQSRQENVYPPSNGRANDDRQIRPFNISSNNSDYSNRQSNPPPPSNNGYGNDRNGYAPAASANRGSNVQGDNRGGSYQNNHPNNHSGSSSLNRTTNSSNYHNNSTPSSAAPASFYIPPAASNAENRQPPAARPPPSQMASTNNAADLNDEEWD